VRWGALAAAVGVLVVAGNGRAQELGHKLVGTLGLQAGVQPPTGFDVAERFGLYTSHELFDQYGNQVPERFRLSVVGVAVGVSFNYRLPRLATYVSVAFSVLVARAVATSESESVRGFGLGDLYVQPLRLGWKLRRFDIVTAYAFYVPTASVAPEQGPTGVSRAQWSHQLSFGGTIYFDRRRTWALSALASYDINGRKISGDVTRGATVQVQGGLGKTFGGIVSVGPVGYALWQVEDDRGSDVARPGGRDRAFGLGAEVDVSVAPLRSVLFCRYAHDFAVETRPEGQLLLAGITLRAWQPSRR
jgi:hypothetical protein